MPCEDRTKSVSCLYEAETRNTSSLASMWVDAAPTGKESLHAAETVGQGAFLGYASKKAKSCKTKTKSNAVGNKFPAAEPVGSLRSALRAQGNQLMQELSMPKSANLPYSNEVRQWHDSLCMTIPRDMMLTPFRPPPGLEDVVASRGPPGVFHAPEANPWTVSPQDAGAAEYPCLLRASPKSHKISSPFEAALEKEGPWIQL